MTEQPFSLLETLKSFTKKKTLKTHTKSLKRSKGDEVETLVCKFLLKQGLILIEKNYSTRAGEVDLIMCDNKNLDTLIFIEVRYRKTKDFGGAAASVTPKKQQRIIKAALAYHQKNAPQSSMRFDVVAVEGDNSCNSMSNQLEIDWIKSAFDGF